MLIIDQEKSNQEIQWVDESTIIFQNKQFTRSLDLAPNAYQKAIKFCCCQRSDQSQPLCLIFKNQHYLTVWIEQQGVSLTDEASALPINSPQPEGRVTDSLDGEPTTNHNQLPVSSLPDLLSKSETSSETPIITQEAGYWYNPPKSESVATPKVPTANVNQNQEIPESEFHLHPRCQQITEKSLKRLSKKKYRGISYEVETILIQLPESELTTDDKAFVLQGSKKKYRGISY
ncbi:hypothetical protein [Moorena producens]|uniref:hypothetical protein n=1 Tax=Moorena producens TaxID=1155739 RepID=UPI003C75FAFE